MSDLQTLDVFNNEYRVAVDKTPHTFTTGDFFNTTAFLTRRGATPKLLSQFVMWFFPRIENPEFDKTDVNYYFGGMPNEYRLALNDLINAKLVEIYEEDNHTFYINLTELGTQYLPKERAKLNLKQEMEKARMYAEEIKKLEAEAPMDKKGFFKSMFS